MASVALKRSLTGIVASLAAVSTFALGQQVREALAAPGALLATVTLPSNGDCNVGLAFTGIHVLALDASQATGCASSTLRIYTAPAGSGAATLVASKNIVDAANAPVVVSAVDWDSSRGMLWGAYLNNVYLIDMGDPTVSGDALATFQFNPNVGGIGLIDGLAWDSSDDTLYHSPDIDCSVYQFSLGTGGNPPLGTLMNTVTPKNAGGVADCDVSGVAIGSANSLYIGRNGNNEIRRVDKTTGAFVSTFATTAGRVEDLVCDPVTYAPLEAVLAKDAFMSLYEAFEVEAGTCPLPVPMCNGRPATIYVDANNIIVGGLENGTPYLGRLRGTNGKDVMVGTDGPDRIWGYDDDDTICGGDGNDQIEGGAGNDWIDGEAGDDRLQGQAGDDTILGGDGNDHISGGNGNDTIGGGPGDDTILGEAGDDDIDGGTGHNTINGGTGVDICVNTGGTGVIKNCNP